MGIWSCTGTYHARHTADHSCATITARPKQQPSLQQRQRKQPHVPARPEPGARRPHEQAHQYRLLPNNADDRRSYESGYDQGYQTARNADRNADRDRSGQNDQYGTRAESNGNLATQNGFQDGANQGLQDRQAGHSSRATKHHDYKEGNRGYSSSFGSKEQFKASYRQAYIQGYEKGYNGQGSDHR